MAYIKCLVLRNKIPEGSTVLPVNDIQIWLHCANIWDKAYTSIAQVLADASTLLALITDDNAVDYMVRSTSWASAVCADSGAMSMIGADNYCADTLLGDSTWLNAIADSTYIESVLNVKNPIMTSNTAPSGVASAIHTYSSYQAYRAFDGNTNTQWVDTNAVNNGAISPEGWIGYQFTTAKKCYCAKYRGVATLPVQTWSIKGSNDGSTWETLGSGTTLSTEINALLLFDTKVDNYKYYRLYLKQKNQTGSSGGHLPQCYDLRFYGREDV